MKYSGMIGFLEPSEEVSTDIYRDVIVERYYTGTYLNKYRSAQNASEFQSTDNYLINDQISILSDLYMTNRWSFIKYVTINGIKWKVKQIQPGYPRIIIRIGEMYNGPQTNETE